MVLEEETDRLLHPIQGNHPVGRGLGQHIDVPVLFMAEEVLHEVVFENDMVRLPRFIGGDHQVPDLSVLHEGENIALSHFHGWQLFQELCCLLFLLFHVGRAHRRIVFKGDSRRFSFPGCCQQPLRQEGEALRTSFQGEFVHGIGGIGEECIAYVGISFCIDGEADFLMHREDSFLLR